MNPLAALVVAKALVGARDEPETDAPIPSDRSAWRIGWRALGRRHAESRPRDDASCVFLAEHYLPDVSAERVDALTSRLEAAAAAARSEGADVRFLGFAALPEDQAFLTLLAAPSSEAAARAVARAEVAADRIVPALWRAARAD